MKKSIYVSIIIIILISVAFLGYQLTQKNQSKSTNMTSPTPAISPSPVASPSPQTEQKQSYSLEQVSQHNNKLDCWLAIDNKVYDVTSFIDKHPGGEAILQGCGKDATVLFKTRPMGSGTNHPEKAYKLLETFYIGDLQ